MNRDFKGVWIKKEIWLDSSMSLVEKALFAEIESLDNKDGCYAKNSYFAEFFQVSEPTISRAVKRLIELKYVKVVAFTGRSRVLKVANQPSQNDKTNQSDEPPESKRSDSLVKMASLDSSTVNNTKNNTDREAPVSKPKKKTDERIKTLIDRFYNTFNEHTGTRPMVNGGWGKQLKMRLRINTEDEIIKVIDDFFAYSKRTDFTFYTFMNRFDALAPRVLGGEKAQAKKSNEEYCEIHKLSYKDSCPICHRLEVEEGRAEVMANGGFDKIKDALQHGNVS